MEISKLTKAQLVPQYLMHSYLYYIEGSPVLSDRSYDLLCIRLLAEWNEVEHPHKDIVDRESLSSGTGFYLKEEDYPRIATIAAREYFLLESEGVQ
jgi:NAD-dependent DNA ligase